MTSFPLPLLFQPTSDISLLNPSPTPPGPLDHIPDKERMMIMALPTTTAAPAARPTLDELVRDAEQRSAAEREAKSGKDKPKERD